MSKKCLSAEFPDYEFYINILTGLYVIIHPDGEVKEYNNKQFINVINGMKKNYGILFSNRDIEALEAIRFIWQPTNNQKECGRHVVGNDVYFNTFSVGKYLMLQKTDEVINVNQFPIIWMILNRITSNDQSTISWLINHLAAKFQNPARKLKSAPILIGQQGCGKGLYTKDVCGGLFQGDNARKPYKDVGKEIIERDFGDFLNKTLIINMNEIASNRRETLDMEDKIKRIVSEDELDVVLFRKGSATIKNYAYVFLSSNHEMPINIEPNDRRYCICMGTGKIDGETGKRYSEVDIPGELPRFAQYLKNHTVDESMLGTVPLTEGKISLIDSCRSDADQVFDMWIDSMTTKLFSVPKNKLSLNNVTDNMRILPYDMMFSEFNAYVVSKHQLHPIKLQRFTRLIKAREDKVICLGERQYYQKRRIIPYGIKCVE
jgi:Family of unknown function (DUF5906)